MLYSFQNKRRERETAQKHTKPVAAKIQKLILQSASSRSCRWMRALIALLIAVWPLLHPHTHSASPQLAYVGPGAGFVFVGSFLSILFGFLAAFFSFLIWPLRMAWLFVTRRHTLRAAHVRQIIFLCMYRLDPMLF